MRQPIVWSKSKLKLSILPAQNGQESTNIFKSLILLSVDDIAISTGQLNLHQITAADSSNDAQTAARRARIRSAFVLVAGVIAENVVVSSVAAVVAAIDAIDVMAVVDDDGVVVVDVDVTITAFSAACFCKYWASEQATYMKRRSYLASRSILFLVFGVLGSCQLFLVRAHLPTLNMA